MDFCCLRKIWVEIKGRNISKNLSGKSSQKLLDHTKRFFTGALKTALKKKFKKSAEATGDLIDNKIGGKITKVLKISLQNNSQSETEIPN